MSETITKLRGAFEETRIDDEVILMRVSDGDFFSLEDTARDIWDALDDAENRAALLDRLASDYGVDRAAIAPEVERFLAEMTQAGLIG